MGIVETQQLKDFLEGFKEQIDSEAKRMKDLEMPQITEELFGLYEQTGNRLKYEEVYFTRRKMLAVFGLKALLEKQEQGRVSAAVQEKLEEIMNSVCDEECWALPAHVDRRENNWQVTVDLFAAETAQTLSELADRLMEEMPQQLHSRIVKNIEWRIFRPFFTSAVPYRGWENSEHNWNAVCAGSIGSACLHLMRNQKERLEQCLERICASLPHYISGFAQDGTCMEGLGYFTYGMTYFVNFARQLYEYSNGEKDLLRGEWAGFHAGEEDKRAAMAAFQSKCYFADGRTVSFSDGNSRDKFRVGLSCALAECFPGAKLPNLSRAAGLMEDNCFRFAALKMDLFETQKYLEHRSGGEVEESDHAGGVYEGTENARAKDVSAGADHAGTAVDGEVQDNPVGACLEILPDAQWCIGSSQSGAGFACKGGRNNEPHNHNDVGHFLYEAQGEMLFTDLGAGEYTRDYFSEKRYEILCNNSFGHSVPIIDGKGQCAGREHGCRDFQAHVLPGKDGERETAIVSMDLADAYELGLLDRLDRTVRFSLKDGSLEVTDRFVYPRGAVRRAVENLVTQIQPVVRDGQVVLQSGSVTGILQIEGIQAQETVTIEEFSHSNHKGEEEKVYAVRWEVPSAPASQNDVTQAHSSFRITCIACEK